MAGTPGNRDMRNTTCGGGGGGGSGSTSDDSESDSWDGVEGGVRRYTKSLGRGPAIER